MLTVPETIKDLLHLDSCKKNIRIHFPNGERTDICNDLIVKNSVSFKESLNSQDTLKFGLCEASVFECETVGVGNIKGATIEVNCEIYCDSEVEDAVWQMDLQAWVYAIPYGTFVVDEAKRQADMNHRKIVAYGGIASKDWGISDFEEGKWLKSKSYNPNMGFWISANGFDVINNIVDETEIGWNDRAGSTNGFSVWNQAPDYRLLIAVHCNTVCWSSQSESNYTNRTDYASNYLYRVDFRLNDIAQTKRQISEFLAPYTNRLEKVDIDLAMNMWTSCHATMYQTNSNVIYAKEYPDIGKYFYPYATSFYSTTSGFHGATLLQVPKGIYIAVYDNESHLIDEIDINGIDNNSKVYKQTFKSAYSFLNDLKFYFTESEPDSSFSEVTEYTPNYSNINLQSLTSAYVEMFGLYGFIGRDNIPHLLDIKQQFSLTPSSTLYPSGSLYPQGVTGGKLLPEDYQSCWYDDDYTLPFGCIRCQYKNTNNNDKILNLFFGGFSSTSSPSSYKIYDLTNNEIIRLYTWEKATIRTICEMIANSIDGVTYMPVEFVGRGLPYVEAGDTFEILTKSNDSITTIVLNRTLTGELTLTDSYKSV